MDKQNRQFKKGEYIGGEYLVHKVMGGEGKSGMGVVYVVTKHDIPYPIVLKTIQGVSSDKQSPAYQRFLREAEVWINFGSHPNIVQAFSTIVIDGQIYVTAEYIYPDSNGRNRLTDYISEGSQPLSDILKWAIQYCDGMIFSLSKGLVAHRDIKPDNLMITIEGNLKITDFGLAKTDVQISHSIDKYDQNDSSIKSQKLTQHGAVLGTLPYIAPEAFTGGKIFDFRADMYAFGIVLYELATNGEYPYHLNQNSNYPEMEFYKAHLFDKPKKIKSPIFSIISKCLEKDPSKRFKNYEEIVIEIQKIAKKEHIILQQRNLTAEDPAADLYGRVLHYEGIGDLDQAKRLAEEYVDRYPFNYSGWTALGTILLKRKEYSESICATSRSIEILPENSHTWNNLGAAYNHLEKWEKSADAFENALLFDELNTGAMMQLASVYIQLNRVKDSIQLLFKALEISPTKNTLLTTSSNIAAAISKNNPGEAKYLLEKLVTLNPENTNNWWNLAMILFNSRKIDAALFCLKKIEKINPNDDDVILTIVNLLGQVGQISEAILYCDKLCRFPKHEEHAYQEKAQYLTDLGEFISSIKIAENRLKIAPDDVTYYYILANNYFHLANYSKCLYFTEICNQFFLKNPSSFSDTQKTLIANLHIKALKANQ